jgi:GWxTD domain-containing protein
VTLRWIHIVSALAAAIMATGSIPGHAPGAAAGPRLREFSRKEVRERSGLLSPPLGREVDALQYVLHPQELAALLSVPSDVRCRRWIEAWWAAHDPDYTTAENEARVAHEDRVLSARAYYGCGEWPGWDDRGEVFIRYGGPLGTERVGADVIPPGIYVPAQEYWFYPQFGMCARFVDPTGGGRYLLSLEEPHLPVGERPRNDRRTMASVENPDFPMDYMTLDADLSFFRHLAPPFAEKGYDDFMETVFRYHEVVEEAPVVYPFDYASMRVPMDFAVHSFRGGEGTDRVDVSTEFAAGPGPGGAGLPPRFATTTVVWDYEGNEVARRNRTDAGYPRSAMADSARTILNQTTMTLPPGSYRVAVTVRDPESGRFTSLRREVAFHDMGEKPAMSDLALAREIGPAREESAFNRGAIEVVPRPSARYLVGDPVPVYFEVYHLGQDEDGLYPYTVEYTITPVRGPRSFWQRFLGGPPEETVRARSRFDSAAPAPQDFVHVAVATEHLWPGEFRLAVTVTDRATSRRVTRETTFHLLP